MESDTTSKIDTIDNAMDVERGQEHNSNFKFVWSRKLEKEFET